MKFTAVIIIPENILEHDYETYIEKILEPYYSELDVPLHKYFEYNKDETLEFVKEEGFSLEEYKLYLEEHGKDKYGEPSGIFDDEIYYWTTWNSKGTWDYYDINSYSKLRYLEPLFSAFILPNGTWIDEYDYGYRMRLNKYIVVDACTTRVEAYQNKIAKSWFIREFERYRQLNLNCMVAILRMHN